MGVTGTFDHTGAFSLEDLFGLICCRNLFLIVVNGNENLVTLRSVETDTPASLEYLRKNSLIDRLRKYLVLLSK